MQIFTPELWWFVCLIFGRETDYFTLCFHPRHNLAILWYCHLEYFEKWYFVIVLISIYSIYIYKNGRTDVCLFVCLLVCKGLMEIQTLAPILMKFCTHIPTCPRKVLVQIWPPLPHPPGPGGLKILKAEGDILSTL